jgi:hypothetical protein
MVQLGNDGTVRVYDWDLQGGPCGVSVEKYRAVAALTSALRSAPAGTRGRVRECVVTSLSGFQPIRTLGLAAFDERTGTVQWFDRSDVEPQTSTRCGGW